MAHQFFWQLPTSADARYGDARRQRRGEASDPHYPQFGKGVSDPRRHAFNYFDYLHQVSRAADLSGFDGIYIPDHPEGEESWIVAGYVARSTQRLKLLTQFDAARGSAVYAAKNAVSFQRYTGGRFAWHITEGSADERVRKQLGDFVPNADILARIDEFITVAKGVLTTYPYNFVGRFFEVQDGGFQGPLSDRKVPDIYLSGSAPDQVALSAKHADLHVLAAAHPDEIAAQIAAYRQVAHDRPVAFALRIDVLARETREEALEDAKRFVAQTGGALPADEQALLWAGFSAQHTGGQASLVGSYDEVAAALAAYAALGISQFVLAAVPHFEEAYRVGTHLLPRFRQLTQTAHKQAA